MQFHIGTEELRFVVADIPAQRKDFESGALRSDAEGRPLFQVRLLAMDGEQSAPIKVGVVGDPGTSQGVFVDPVGLTLNVVDRRGDSVVWWTADRLEVAGVPGGGSAAGGKAAAGKASGAGGKGAGE